MNKRKIIAFIILGFSILPWIHALQISPTEIHFTNITTNQTYTADIFIQANNPVIESTCQHPLTLLEKNMSYFIQIQTNTAINEYSENCTFILFSDKSKLRGIQIPIHLLFSNQTKISTDIITHEKEEKTLSKKTSSIENNSEQKKQEVINSTLIQHQNNVQFIPFTKKTVFFYAIITFLILIVLISFCIKRKKKE